MKLLLIAYVALAFSTTAAAQGNRPDPAAGKETALKLCTNCHLVVDSQQGPVPDNVPSFRTVAKTHAGDSAGIRAFLNDPHPLMPRIQLSRKEIDDIIAYIETLAP